MKTGLIAAACGFVVLATASSAQVPANIAEKVRAAGQAMDPTIGQLYAPMFPKEAWAGVSIQRDIAYGSDRLQKLDVFTPDGAKGKKLPVLLFVHGGGFTRGDKHGDFYPDNITLWAAKNGMVGVNIDYRLAPKDPWPAGVKDLASAIAWTHANIARYGGDPNRIVLFGHSAGANHVADYAAHPEVRGAEASSVKGVIMLSPVVFHRPGRPPERLLWPGRRSRLGAGADHTPDRQSVPAVLWLCGVRSAADEGDGHRPDRGPVPDQEPLPQVCGAEGLQPLLRGHGGRHA